LQALVGLVDCVLDDLRREVADLGASLDGYPLARGPEVDAGGGGVAALGSAGADEDLDELGSGRREADRDLGAAGLGEVGSEQGAHRSGLGLGLHLASASGTPRSEPRAASTRDEASVATAGRKMEERVMVCPL